MIVLDSSFLIAYHNERDGQHEAARAAMDEFLAGKWGTGLLLEYVFLEVVTVIAVRRNLATAARVGRLLLGARELEFLPCSEIFLETFDVFCEQPATKLSFADAAIAAAARSRANGWVLTFDQEFEKAPGLLVAPG